MIIKELDPFTRKDKFQVAGRLAEEQMAFYLRRYFSDADDIYVINDLKLGKDGESLQVDHLVIHQHGLFIIESKSVSDRIIVTKDHQWIRKFKDTSSGMKSPIIQTEMQKMLLQSILKELRTEYKCLFPLDEIYCLIAISDKGIIEWEDHEPIDGVHKADQICKIIKNRIETSSKKRYKKIPENEYLNWIENNWINKAYTDYGELIEPNRSVVVCGNIPEWIAEFFCECHAAHLHFHKKNIPPIFLEMLNEKAIQEIIEHDWASIRIIFEILAYALLWHKIYEKRENNMRSIIRVAERTYLCGGVKLAKPVRRSKKEN